MLEHHQRERSVGARVIQEHAIRKWTSQYIFRRGSLEARRADGNCAQQHPAVALMIRIRPSIPRLSTRIHGTGARCFTNSATHFARAGAKNHWAAEKLRTTEKYPLTLELFDKAHPESEEAEDRRNRGHARNKKKTTTNRYTRPQIVSPSLCGTSCPKEELLDLTSLLTRRLYR